MALGLFAGLWLALCAGYLTTRGLRRGGGVNRRLAHVERYGLAAATPDLVVAEVTGEIEDPEDVARTGIARLGRLVARRIAPKRVASIRRNLLAAGRYDTTAEAFLGTQVLTFAGVAALVPLLVAGLHLDTTTSVFVGIVGLYVGIALPIAGLSRRARGRLTEIDREMPELVDVLVVAVESGLGLVAALDRASSRIHGPLGDELRLTMREHSLGASLHDVLANMSERVPTGAVVSFTRTLSRGERLGLSVGQLLRAAAEDMRKRRIARAQELAHRAPVKMLFPLVFCIFPAMLVVLVAPAGISLLKGLGGG